ncbi:MAG: CDP-alcohol phosphatidyltransferase family protein [Gemmatimonadetes bacterium]|nr:CDP-alcohol phosphatidyltransferase family protein [Gemmatimonadota bacterium]
MVWTLPNILTVSRIALTPVVALLPFINGYLPKLIAFVVFVIAAISDLIDGHLARQRDEVTDLGKLLDPIADKLLLFAALIPIFAITRSSMSQYGIPWWGNLPLIVLLLLVGREIAMTVFRHVAKGRGVVIAADSAGKIKTVVQNIFLGATIAWFAWRDMRVQFGWETGWLGDLWNRVHGAVVAVTLGGALVLTVFSLLNYFYRYRNLFRSTSAVSPKSGHGA